MSIRLALIGAGHLGRVHARLISEMSDVSLLAVVDPDPQARQEVAQACGCEAWAEYRPLLPQLDAAIVAAPSQQHARIAQDLLTAGLHVFVEKPLATSRSDADRLVQIAESHRRVLQVGQVERFNPAWRASVERLPRQPTWIQVHRLAPYSYRCTDVGVVLDLMIHDLDLLLHFLNQPVTHVSATGGAVLGPHEDFAHAYLEFEQGCSVSLVASRVHPVATRVWQITSPETFATIDFGQRTCQLLTRVVPPGCLEKDGPPPPRSEWPGLRDRFFQDVLRPELVSVSEANPIQVELQQFLTAIRHGRPPEADGRAGRDAVGLAERILEQMHQRSSAVTDMDIVPQRPLRRAG